MGIKEVLGELRKDAPSIILLIILGIIIDQSLFRGSIALSTLRISIGISFCEVIKLLANIWNRRRQERIRQEGFLVKDFKEWINKTDFTMLNYKNGEISIKLHKDPDLDSLPYYNEDVQMLEKCEIYALWIKGREKSIEIMNKGENALKTFQKIVDEKLKKIPLKKSLKIGILSEPYMSTLRIRETIFSEINDYHMELDINEQGFLCWGEVRLARGENRLLEYLKNIILELIKDEKVKNQIEIYNEAKVKLDSGETFKEFIIRLNKLIADWERFHEFKIQI